MTTRQPSDAQVEVAIAALQAVLVDETSVQTDVSPTTALAVA